LAIDLRQAFVVADLRTSSASTASYAGLTRVSIHLRKSLSKVMDCRVKPGNDGSTLHALLLAIHGRLDAA
jgi:hypothetical protein